MAFHAEAITEQKRNPISTLDDAVLWLAGNHCMVDFNFTDNGRTTFVEVAAYGDEMIVTRKIGDGGFDARGTLMMATRELWEKVNA